jgi:ABC-type molybdenum transport system ATPase subunit/photorepair protein PhrA
MSTLLSQIRTWAADLKYWEQSALEKIITGTEITESDYSDLLNACLQDAGLSPISSSRPRLSFPARLIEADQSNKCALVRMLNLQNVNALPSGQELRFGPNLTLIYGDNGAGKTGYARPLGAAAFTRGDREVLTNAVQPVTRGIPQADIEISIAGVRKTVNWRSGTICPELSGFYVFSSNSLDAHLIRSNPLRLSPSGLKVLTRLAEVTDGVRERLKRLIEGSDVPHNFAPLFEGDSIVTRNLSALSEHTDINTIRELALLNDGETIGGLEEQIAALKSQNILDQLTRLRQEVLDLKTLVKALTAGMIDDNVVEEARKLIADVANCRTELERFGEHQFKSEMFSQVGTQVWREFIAAAKALADTEYEQGMYPQGGDYCLLCRQSLSPEAVNLIQRLLRFLNSDAQSKLEHSQARCAAYITKLERIDLTYFGADSIVRRLVINEVPSAVAVVEAHIAACLHRKEKLVASMRASQMLPVPSLNIPELTAIQELIAQRETKIADLSNSNAATRLRELELALRSLKHRTILREHIAEIEAYIQRRKWISRAREAGGSTQHITKKYNEIFKELVTDRYVELFQSMLDRFKANIKIQIQAWGQKGETVRQIVLTTALPQKFPVEKVLSDGEKRVAALADFLTETALDQFCNGIILDDPVTSMDNNWKNILAQCLVEQAEKQQVVVFTHDLAFLYHVKEHADHLGVSVVSHWVREEEGQPGFIYLDNSPVCEKDYKSAAKAREYYSKAIDLPPAEQQSMLQLGFGALRTSYEALVIFGLFNNVVARFEERVRFDALKDVHIETEIVEEIVNRMSILSRYIEAHLHSDSYGGAKPTPAMLLDEIEAFEGIKRRHKSYGQTKQDTRVASPSTERTTTSKGEIGDGKQGQGNRQVN